MKPVPPRRPSPSISFFALRGAAAGLVAVAALGVAAPAAAGDGKGASPPAADADGGRRGRRGLDDGAREELRARVQQKIQTYLTVELSSRAGLDEKKSLQLGAAIKSHLERRTQTRKKKHEEMQKLRALVDGKGADAALKAQIKAVVDEGDRAEQLQALLDETARFLTPTEQAKIVLAFPEVMKDTHRLIRDARRGRGGPGGRGGPDGPDDDLE